MKLWHLNLIASVGGALASLALMSAGVLGHSLTWLILGSLQGVAAATMGLAARRERRKTIN